MTPKELASKHPKLFHVTEASAWLSIAKHGLLSTKNLLELFEIQGERKDNLMTKRRQQSVSIRHDVHGEAILTDNIPLNLKSLSDCLDDELTPENWIEMLNSRVFFFTNKKQAVKFLQAASNTHRQKLVLVLDTLTLAECHVKQMELCPFNSGTANPRSVPRRGLSTFSPLSKYSYREWVRLRSRKKEKIQEVVVLGAVNDIEKYLVERILA